MDGPSSPLLLFVPSLAVFKNDPSKGDQGWKLVFSPVPEEDTLAWLILYHGSYKGFSRHQGNPSNINIGCALFPLGRFG